MARQRQTSQPTARISLARRRDAAAQSVPATEFKAHCLSLLERVRQSRRPLIVTKHGRPVVKVVPFPTPRRAILGFSKGTVKILGDIVAPTGERWEVDGG